MTPRIEELKDFFIVQKKHHAYRQGKADPYRFARKYEEEGLSDLERTVRRLEGVLGEEIPVVFPNEKICLMRTVCTLPEIFTEEEFRKLREDHYIHEQGKVCNINVDYTKLLDVGLEEKRKELERRKKDFQEAGKEKEAEYETALLRVLDAIGRFAERYRKEAARIGNREVERLLGRVPRKRPKTFLEALMFLRMIHYCMWISFHYHNTLGRFDQYLYPYYEKDIREGRMTKEEALELLEEFFLTLNRDSDLYTGMQQGDNGQSMVLGGKNPDGSESFHELSSLCLQASLELKLIDPKINVRVSRDTPLSIYEEGTRLTKQGLGFPQYSNDDVVIPALIDWGYEKEDAYHYCVAACWEFIIPGCGMDIPNINGLSFPRAIQETMEEIENLPDFPAFLDRMKRAVVSQAEELMNSVHRLYMEPAPLLSLMMDGCVEKAKDVSLGNKYNNFGFHGSGLSTAVDSLASIEKYVYDEKTISRKEMLRAVHTDFEGQEQLLHMLRFEGSKFGNDDDRTDRLAVLLLDWFADALEGRKNERGGIYRAGTGSAMYYIWQSKNLGATPDGRRKGEEFACNYSPSLFSRLDGPVSMIKSFTKPHLKRVANGGPLTVELDDTMFRNEESTTKTAMFIKSFIDLGGHQMQINAVNREILLDAKAHPENYQNLIVRVWGWSGYFVELDECYQDHIIKRMELAV